MPPIVYGLAYVVFLYVNVSIVPCDVALEVLRNVEVVDNVQSLTGFIFISSSSSND